MCRLFGCSVSEDEDNVFHLKDIAERLHILSEKHADGWGVAYYHHGIPHIMRSERSAKECQMFSKMALQIRSHMMLVHLRKATIGPVDILNTHPFQHGKWVFAHNGHIKCPEENHVCLESEINKDLRHCILGDTDSEQLFYMFMGSIFKFESKSGILSSHGLRKASADFVQKVRDKVGPFEKNPLNIGETFLSFLASDGRRLIAFQGGQELYWKQGVGVNIISDPIHSKEQWTPIEFGEAMIVENGQIEYLDDLGLTLGA